MRLIDYCNDAYVFFHSKSTDAYLDQCTQSTPISYSSYIHYVRGLVADGEMSEMMGEMIWSMYEGRLCILNPSDEENSEINLHSA